MGQPWGELCSVGPLQPGIPNSYLSTFHFGQAGRVSGFEELFV